MDPRNSELSEVLPKNKNGDFVLANELSAMSVQERERVYHDIHGVSELIKEEPQLLEVSLAQLEEGIQNISKREAYEQALSQNAEYVTDRKFRLKFLRADSFDPQAAAARLVKFLEQKSKLFGVEKLTQDIKLSDLTVSDKQCIEAGICQLLPFRDQAGRGIQHWMPMLKESYHTTENMMRMCFYSALAASEDEEVQRNGLVLVAINTGPRRNTFDMSVGLNMTPMFTWLPIRYAGAHFCIDNISKYAMLSFVKYMIGNHIRVRCRVHYGTNQEIRYTLMTFGIPTNILPIDDDGTILPDNHRDWMEQRVELEKIDTTNQITYISTPGPFDILFGRGKAAVKHPGNMRYKFLIEETSDRYENASKADKTLIAEELLFRLKGSNGGRFLKLEKNKGWMEVDDVAAREKISMSFRDRRQQSRREQCKEPALEPSAGVTMTLSSLFRLDPGFGDIGQLASQSGGKRPRTSETIQL